MDNYCVLDTREYGDAMKYKVDVEVEAGLVSPDDLRKEDRA